MFLHINGLCLKVLNDVQSLGITNLLVQSCLYLSSKKHLYVKYIFSVVIAVMWMYIKVTYACKLLNNSLIYLCLR